MTKKSILFVLFFILLLNYGYPAKLHTFIDLVYPAMFAVDNEYIYISALRNPGNVIYIYDRNDFKLVKALLTKGEGPREVISHPTIAADENKINIFTGKKIILYSKKFEYLNEIKLSLNEPSFAPVKDRYIISHLEGKDTDFQEIYSLYNIQGNQLNKIKELFRLPVNYEDIGAALYAFASLRAVWKDKVFIATHEDLHIDVFDENGSKLYSIEEKLKKIKPEEKHMKRILEKFESIYGKIYKAHNMEKRLRSKKIKKILPDLQGIYAGEDRLYIHTYDIKGDEDKYLIMDFKGNIIDTKWLPKAFSKKRYFFDNCFYYFLDNENGNGWELHMVDLK
jgi:uncharacterized protein YdcH (DUF465 family)